MSSGVGLGPDPILRSAGGPEVRGVQFCLREEGGRAMAQETRTNLEKYRIQSPWQSDDLGL